MRATLVRFVAASAKSIPSCRVVGETDGLVLGDTVGWVGEGVDGELVGVIVCAKLGENVASCCSTVGVFVGDADVD